MDSVIFVDFSRGKKVKGWNFTKVYPSVLSNKMIDEEIWITNERLHIPVGAKKVFIKFYLWIISNKDSGTYTCRVGMVPDASDLDDKAIDILKDSTRGDFFKDPYYSLLHERDYRSIFLEETDVKEVNLESVRDAMKSSVSRVEKNLIYFLQGGSDKRNVKDSGWSVLVRARSGSI